VCDGGRDGTLPLLELEVGAIATGGGCVAHVPDGRVAFVRHCLPGERVLARITSLGASFVRADALEILHSSEDRVSPRALTPVRGTAAAATSSTSRWPASGD